MGEENKAIMELITFIKYKDECYEAGMVIQKLIDKLEEKDKEIEKLENIIKDIKSQLDYLETYSSKEDVFEDMKRRLDRIESIIGDDKE